MSVKFEKESVKLTEAASAAAGVAGGKEDLAHQVGKALTKGGGANGYLAVGSSQLSCPSEQH
jgi:hypothetical protein